LELGEALTFTSDAVSEIEARLRSIAAAYGYERARISVLPTLLIVAMDPRQPASLRTVDSFRQLRLDQASAVICLAESAETGTVAPHDAVADLLWARRTTPSQTDRGEHGGAPSPRRGNPR
jgi:hypothetical protein